MSKKLSFKVEKDRVLVPVGIPCPFGCRYCYTRGGEVGPARPYVEDILAQFECFAHEVSFETIQFGYDSDPFAYPTRGIAMLHRLAQLGKNVNFSTKAALDIATVNSLKIIQLLMETHNATLSALVSLSCWDSASAVEPHTPTPQQRMTTIARLKQIGLPVFIAVRPVLPHIADEEYMRIALEGIQAGCDGFILGPLYTNDRGQFVRFIPQEILQTVPCRKSTVSWSAHAPLWTRYEDSERLQRLTMMIESQGGRVFHSSADAMALVSQNRKSVTGQGYDENRGGPQKESKRVREKLNQKTMLYA